MPRDVSRLPAPQHIAAYFDAYVDHFGLRDRITFETLRDARRAPRDGGGWDVTTDRGGTRAYDALVVANGHHWDPRWPEPAFPGHDRFAGEPRCTRTRTRARTRRCSATATSSCSGWATRRWTSRSSPRSVARRTYLAARRGAWVIPKYLFGRPLDTLDRRPRGSRTRSAAASQAAALRLMVGDMERYGLPRPDHPFGSAHPTVSDDVLSRIAHGEITPKPNIAELTERTVRFADGTEVEADVVVYCTGYKVSSRSSTRTLIAAPDNDLPLFRRVFHPDVARDLLRRPAAAARRDHAAGRAAVAVDLRPPRTAATRSRRRTSCARTWRPSARRCSSATSPRSGTRCRSTSRTTCSRAQERRRGAARAELAGGGCRRAARDAAPADAPRATKAANRAALVAAARDAFGELGLRGRRRARHRPPHGPGVGHVLQLLPRQGGDLPRRASRTRARRRGGGSAPPARARRTLAAFVAAGYRAYFAFIVEDPATFAFLRRNLGALGAAGLEHELPLGARRAGGGPPRAGGRGALPPLDVDYCAHAMVAVGVELGARHRRARAARRRGRDALRHRLFLAARAACGAPERQLPAMPTSRRRRAAPFSPEDA